jgi:3-oxoacyl-[acyl-carrier protein] reductase
VSGALDGRVAVVTGSGRGIGAAAARLLGEQGAAVVINDLDQDVADAAAAQLPGPTATFAGDLRAAGGPEALIQTAIDAFGRLDIVVNNAGFTVDAPLHKLDDEQFQAMLDIHTVVPFRVLRAAAPHLREPAKRERAEGVEVFRKVVNVSSLGGTMGNAGQANYAAGKAGVVGLTKTLAKEWGQFKINVNAVAFGFVETRMTATKGEGTVADIAGRRVPMGVPADARAALTAMIPLGRPATVREAAGGIAFLASPWSDYVHGQVLNVSGGLIAGMGS